MRNKFSENIDLIQRL